MPVIMAYQEGLNSLSILTAAWWFNRWLGLFQNDWNPQNYQEIGAVVPADFSGYPGLTPLGGWLAPAQVGAQAQSSASNYVFTHDGGPLENYIFGAYVVDSAGRLCWAERISDTGIPMFLLGHVLAYRPVIALQSIFPSW